MKIFNILFNFYRVYTFSHKVDITLSHFLNYQPSEVKDVFH